MSDNGSQKLDIEDICDAVVGSIDGNVSDILTAATSEVQKDFQVDLLGAMNAMADGLREVNEHLRIITGETPNERDI